MSDAIDSVMLEAVRPAYEQLRKSAETKLAADATLEAVTETGHVWHDGRKLTLRLYRTRTQEQFEYYEYLYFHCQPL